MQILGDNIFLTLEWQFPFHYIFIIIFIYLFILLSSLTMTFLCFQADIFKGFGDGILRMLSLNIQHRLFLPNQIIIKRGDVGTQMYFIHKGAVEVSINWFKIALAVHKRISILISIAPLLRSMTTLPKNFNKNVTSHKLPFKKKHLKRWPW